MADDVDLDFTGTLAELALRRPVFHSERDFQHAFALQLQLRHPRAQIRLEPRPRRGVHLDLLIHASGERTAVELKYPLAGFQGAAGGESFDLPHQSANDIGRHDVIGDIVRVETLLADGYADRGYVLVLTNDGSYWRSSPRPDTIDAAFRIHEGRVLEGTLSWAARAGRGTTSGRDIPLALTGQYPCHWRDYSQATASSGRLAQFRYLLLAVIPHGNGGQTRDHRVGDSS